MDKIRSEKNKIVKELQGVAAKISLTRDDNFKGNKKIEELRATEQKINQIRTVKNEMERKLGRIEGMIEIEEKKKEEKAEIVEISQLEIKGIINEIHTSINEAMAVKDIAEIRPILERIKNILGKFNKEKSRDEDSFEIESLKKDQKEILLEMKKIEDKETEIDKAIEVLNLAEKNGVVFRSDEQGIVSQILAPAPATTAKKK